MEIYIPQTIDEWMPLAVPITAFLIGLAYFVAPRLVLNVIGLTGSSEHPEAYGEGRSTFAGFPLGLSIAAFLFGQPILLAMLGAAFAAAILGKIVQIAFDDGYGHSVFIRLLIAIGLAVAALYQADMPELALRAGQGIPEDTGELLAFGVALITLSFGLICLLFPGIALKLLRMEERSDRPGAKGELRGLLAGFYLATGMFVLIDGGIFVLLALGSAWFATAFGRLISILSDRAGNLYNWAALIFELVLGAIPFAVVLDVI
ncbi:MAG: DUF4345 family protein [Rhizobiaceae bacterium]